MAGRSNIEWTEATWNPIKGCKVLSPGCTNCYAMRMAGTRLKSHPSYAGLTIDTKAGPVWTGEMRFDPKALLEPLRWRAPRVIFVNSMSDLFADPVPDEQIDQVFAVMCFTPQHTYQVLTKRSARMRDYIADRLTPQRIAQQWAAIGGELYTFDKAHQLVDQPWPLPNVWLGVSAEDQPRFDERIGHLKATPAAIRFISFEPLIGPIKARKALLDFDAGNPGMCVCRRTHGFDRCLNYGSVSPTRTAYEGGPLTCEKFRRPPGSLGIHWAIVGGESGGGARPMQAEWARQLRDECTAAGVEFFFKQWGEYAPTSDANGPYMMRVGKKAAGRLLDGRTHDDRPEVLA